MRRELTEADMQRMRIPQRHWGASFGEISDDPKETVGNDACPINALYWDFLMRNSKRLSKNPRMRMSYRNLDRKNPGDLNAIRAQASRIRDRLRQGALV